MSDPQVPLIGGKFIEKTRSFCAFDCSIHNFGNFLQIWHWIKLNNGGSQRFFSGNRSAEDAARVIQSRVQTYVWERQR